jgi:ABC-type long-subunit fatty acid transport system fused permease/ATPase subunit
MDIVDKFGIALEASLWAMMAILPIFYLLSLWIVPNYPLIKQFTVIIVQTAITLNNMGLLPYLNITNNG